MPVHARVNWEFFAVLEGAVAARVSEGDTVEPAGDTLWLFPPNVIHGWKSHPGVKCKVLVVHYSQVPNALEQATKGRGFLSVRLNAKDKQSLRILGKILKRQYHSPDILSEIICDRALMDLSLVLLRGVKKNSALLQSGANLDKVHRAEKWLLAHLDEPLSINRTAKAVGISASQLCRVFHKVRNKTPHQALMAIRMDKAMRLMADSDAKLDKIAGELGFSGASNFCRAFKAHLGKSPTIWRREIYIRYKKPTSHSIAGPEQHGLRSRAL